MPSSMHGCWDRPAVGDTRDEGGGMSSRMDRTTIVSPEVVMPFPPDLNVTDLFRTSTGVVETTATESPRMRTGGALDLGDCTMSSSASPRPPVITRTPLSRRRGDQTTNSSMVDECAALPMGSSAPAGSGEGIFGADLSGDVFFFFFFADFFLVFFSSASGTEETSALGGEAGGAGTTGAASAEA